MKKEFLQQLVANLNGGVNGIKKKRQPDSPKNGKRIGRNALSGFEALEDRSMLAALFAQFVDPHPNAGNKFGDSVVALSTGNVVITSPYDDAGGVDAGAAYLFNGSSGALISTLKGSTASDNVGSGGVVALSNGNFVVISPSWDKGAAVNAGAVTFGDGKSGVAGAISSINSLVGSQTNDQVGISGVTALKNGNYVIRSVLWDNGGSTDAGAVTFGNGSTGIAGTVTSLNSLVGSKSGDNIGIKGVVELSNGNYVVISPNWGNGLATKAGAVTFGSGATGVSGTVSSGNSLVGSKTGDAAGFDGVVEVGNSNYLIESPKWGNGLSTNSGAMTFGKGTTGVSGTISAANSLVGSKTDDSLGYSLLVQSNGNYVVSNPSWDNGIATNAGAVTFGSATTGVAGNISSANSLVGSKSGDSDNNSVVKLSNGSYVVSNPSWDKGAAANAGAVTFGNATTGITGAISGTNSLIGSIAGDSVGNDGVRELSNGNYVVVSSLWDNGIAQDAGAVTFIKAAVGLTGAVSSLNSLVGSKSGDNVGAGLTKLNNGNYVVVSPLWDRGIATNAGAVTFGSGTSGVVGAVSTSNSLVGSKIDDKIGSDGVIALSNGNYVVSSTLWDNGLVADVGAVTFGNGTIGISGSVSTTNSLVGVKKNDNVGHGVTALTNGNYVVNSPNWSNGNVANTGAVTFGNGTTGIVGPVTTANSLTGSKANDNVGLAITALTNGNYVVSSGNWDNGNATNAGAVTFGNGTTGIVGSVSSANSLVGSKTGDGVGTYYDGSVTELKNGNYVISSKSWGNGAATNAGAVTFGSGTTGVAGTVSSANSLVGSKANDNLGGFALTKLYNGNYVVFSPFWDNGLAADAGAVTFGNGTTGIAGTISSANSLVGTKAGDYIGADVVDGVYVTNLTLLANGNFTIGSPFWDNGSATNAGAVTFGSVTAGMVGIVSSLNSLVGSTTNDGVGAIGSVIALSNGNYLVRSTSWNNGAAVDAGAITFGSKSLGVSGVISSANSLIGLASNTNLQSVGFDNTNQTFFGIFLNEGGGKVRVGSQINGFAPNTLSATIDALGNLTVTDIDSAGKDNQFNLAVNGNKYVVTDTNELFAAAPAGWTLASNGKYICIPVSSFSGSITFNGVLGNDTLQLNSTVGNPIPAGGVKFNGGNGSDVLNFIGTLGADAISLNSSGFSFNGANVAINSVETLSLDGRAQSDVFTLLDRPVGVSTLTLTGNSGNDSYRFSTANVLGTIFLDETGGGVDTLDFSQLTSNVAINLGLGSTQFVNANLSLNLKAGNTFENAFGGAGNDSLTGNSQANTLIGNGGNDILVGLSGDDVLQGNGGRDILIGGLGSDNLDGGADDDILIAGFTNSDSAIANLQVIRAEWVSANTYAARIANIRAGVGAPPVSLKALINVFDDSAAADTLTGGVGNDWYFKAASDTITDQALGEIVDLL